MKRDLSLLSILHYLNGAFICLSGFAAFLLIGLGVFLSSDFVADQSGGDAAPGWIGVLFQTFGWVFLLVVEAWGLLNIASGYWISRRRNRAASQVIAAFNCLNFPLGMALGIYTLISLNDHQVRQEYGGERHRFAYS
ncbi:MAG TPA: hypothetical protein PKJ19_11340 [Flavobacteriales bacterium]|nr:hypothetical protein [Flavobacteriales bacterium]